MATIVYVDSSNTAGTQDGTNWAGAFYNFQDGIDAAVSGDSIWVAKGTYLPPPTIYFVMKAGVKIFGGFLNTHTSFNQRNPQTNVTRLKGNNNSVIRNYSNNLTGTAVLDGFTITGGFNNGSSSFGSGGGIYNQNVSPAINNCIFSGNSISGGYGGGGAIYNTYSSPVITNCTFTSNNATLYNFVPSSFVLGGGGAIYNTHSAPVITNCTFTSNTATSSYQIAGGGIFNTDGSAPVLKNCIFTSNSSPIRGGGAIFSNLGSSLNIDSCTFNTNHANGPANGGAIFNDSLASFIIKHSSFTGNTAYFGGAIYNNKCQSITIDTITFTGNTASNFGGGMYSLNSLFNMVNCSFIKNICSGSSTTEGGGAMYNSTTSYNMSYTSFTGNKATNANGGGIFNTSYSTSAPINISYCTFTKDTALYNGGGFYHTIGTPNIINCTFTENVSGEKGAGMFHQSASPSVSYCTFLSNRSIGGGGAGIYNYSAYLGLPIPINNCTFTTNSSGGHDLGEGGGGISNQNCSPVINNCIFSANAAFRGGAIDNYSSAPFSLPSAEPDILNCTFSNNVADSIGGAINGATDTLLNCSFTSNSATYKGGGLLNPGATLILNCTFSSNAAQMGAGMFNSNARTQIMNSIFSRNTGTDGGGMYNNVSSPYVTNCTFVSNVATNLGGGIYNVGVNTNDSSLNFVNSIIWGNNSGVYNAVSASANYTYSIVQGLGAFPARHLLAGTTNPLFVDTAANNYSLLSNTPCYNKGRNQSIPTGISTDIAGNNRIVGDTVDLGAFELGNIPLSLDLITFTGKSQNNKTNLLQWETANEKGGISFELQRSNNGNKFEEKTRIKSIGSGNNKYQFVDQDILFSNNFYRLKMINEDGKVSYSNVINLYQNLKVNSCSIYPNPAESTVTIEIHNKNLIHTNVFLLNIYGKNLQTIYIEDAVQVVSLDGLASGTYLLKTGTGEVFKIIKH